MKIQKIIKIGSFILLQVILLLASSLVGMYNERERMKKEEQAETVENIAIVNLDRGIYEDHAVRYYSQELMNLEADNLVSESLEAARQGINNGNYAAYVIIPAEFSENAVSLNTIPEKATLEFAVNPNLREDVSRLTMSNIKNFEINLNTNMSYMYVQAILEEFHAVQDSSGMIMKNDNDEMARIMEMSSEALMASPKPMSPEWVDPEIEDVDFSSMFETNSQISEQLWNNYDEFALQGEEAFEVIKKGEEEVVESLDIFLDIVMEIDIETDADGNAVYEQGIVEMSECLEEYGAEFIEQKNKIYNRIDAAVMVTPAPTPTIEVGTETPVPSASMIPGSPTPTANSDKTPVPTASPVGTPVSTEFPEETPMPTQLPTPTPEIKPIPLIIKETLDDSLQKTNQKIEEHNKADENVVQEIRETIVEIKKLLGDSVKVSDKSSKGSEQENRGDYGSTGTTDAEEAELEKQVEEDGTRIKMTDQEETESGRQDKEDDEGKEKPDVKNDEILSEPEEEETIFLSYLFSNKKYPLHSNTYLMQIDANIESAYTGISVTEDQVKEILVYLDTLEEKLGKIEKLDEMVIEEIYEEETIRQEFKELAAEIEALPELDVVEYQRIFEESILKPIQEKIMDESKKIQEEAGRYMEIQSEYIMELEMFDPYEYYDYEKMDELNASFAENIFDLEEKVFKSQTGYLELVYDTVDLSNKSMDAMKENLDEAYGGTQGNIEKEVDLAKQYRKSINETNIAILGGFQEKLPYTRVGNLEYVQAYDFMVKPIRMWDNSVVKKRISFWQNYDMLKNILVALLIIWGLSVFAQIGIRLYEDKKEEFDKE